VNPSPAPRVEHHKLTLGKQLGQGGQGTVHEVTNRKINEAAGDGWDVVYKEYGPAVLPALRADALASRAELIGELKAADAKWLCERTAWPAAVVQRHGHTCGFLMRAVPARFRFAFRNLGGATGTQRLASMEYLLNDDAYVAGIGLTISVRDRLALLGDLATTLSRLHGLGITVGDLSPKNLLFATAPHPECFLIDADAMRLRGDTVLPQAETPDWQIPDGEEKATCASDVYKLALLAVRLIARDQTATDPTVLTPVSPALAALARSSLDPDPARRPTPAQWAETLAAAGTTASTVPASASASATGRRTRRTQRTPHAPGNLMPAGSAPTRNPARTKPTSKAKPTSKTGAGFAASIAVVLVALLALAITHSNGGDSGSTSESASSAASDFPTVPDSTPTDLTFTDPDPTDLDPATSEPATSEPDTPSATPTPDAIADAQVGSCFYDNGTSGRADLVATDCTDGAFKVVRIYSDTTDLSSCDDVTDSDESVSSARHDRVLCLSYQSPGGTAYHADQGDCVYGSHGTGPWSTQTCQTGNFKVLAVYRGTSDHSKCDSWPHYNQWKRFGVASDSGLDVLLCLSMNYPDDAGYAKQNQCLFKSGSEQHATFTNVGSCAASNVVVTGRTSQYGARAFCGSYGWTTWRPSDFPALAYTVCWRPK
jgi:serine/threonine protein kinase